MAGKLDIAEGIAKEALEIPAVRSAAEAAAGAASKLLHDTLPSTVTGTAEKIGKAAEDAFSRFDSSGYRHVPMRSLATEIRTGDGVSMRSTDGPSKVLFGADNKVQHVLFSKNLSAAERADHLQAAAYAGLIHDDMAAHEAAGKMMGQSAGFISRPIERFASPEQLQQNAIDGAKAYVERDASGANNYTRYLTERFGPQTEESQGWSQHIVNGDGPENVFSSTFSSPSNLDLTNLGMPITPANRTAATNPVVFRKTPGDRF